jgi:predicted transcriptional regulator
MRRAIARVVADMSRHDERNAQILARRAKGETYSAIAEDYGLSRQRVEQIAAAADRPKRSEPARLPLPKSYIVRIDRTGEANRFLVSTKNNRVIATTVFSERLGRELGSPRATTLDD